MEELNFKYKELIGNYPHRFTLILITDYFTKIEL